MDPTLAEQAEALGINVSLYFLLPSGRRERALAEDIERAKARRKKEEVKDTNGHD